MNGHKREHHFESFGDTKPNEDQEPGDLDQSGDIMVLNGISCAAAHSLEIGTPTDGERVGFVQIVLAIPGAGLYVGVSPAYARKIASELTGAAEIAAKKLEARANALMQRGGQK